MSDEIPHTLTDFEVALKDLKKSVLLMASAATQNLNSAITGLFERNKDLCNQAIAEDETVNNFERSINEDGVDILMRYTPVATDLREVVGAMKISTNLERISDQAENIARRARKISKKPELAETRLIEPIFEVATSLMDSAVKAFSDGDVDLALSLYDRDQDLDAMHSKAIKRLTREMENNVDNLRTYLHLIFIIRCLERVGDHSVNVGEEVVYILSAADIKHVGPSALEEEE